MADLGIAELLSFQDGMTDQQKMIFTSQYNSDKKDRQITIILSAVLGTMGVDRFYVGDSGLGVVKLLTVGGCGIWWIVDLFLITQRADAFNRQKATEIAYAIRAMAQPAAQQPPQQPPQPGGY